MNSPCFLFTANSIHSTVNRDLRTAYTSPRTVNGILPAANPVRCAANLTRYTVNPFGCEISRNPVSGKQSSVYGRQNPLGRPPIPNTI
ncbi:hypothetical protein [Sinomicrobium sp. M5D2P9]